MVPSNKQLRWEGKYCVACLLRIEITPLGIAFAFEICFLLCRLFWPFFQSRSCVPYCLSLLYIRTCSARIYLSSYFYLSGSFEKATVVRDIHINNGAVVSSMGHRTPFTRFRKVGCWLKFTRLRVRVGLIVKAAPIHPTSLSAEKSDTEFGRVMLAICI